MKYRLVVLFALIYTGLVAQKYSNEFLSIGVSAKAQGMGNAQAASVSDVTAGFWNPAGLANVEGDLQVSFMHAEWFASNGNYDYLGIVRPLGDDKKRALGFSLIRFGIDNIPNTLSLYEDDGTVNYDNIKPFSAADYAFLFSYAQELREGFNVGGNFKVIHRTIGPFATSWGFGLDAGIQYKTGDFTFGVMGKDITSTFNAWSINFTDEEQQILELTNNDINLSSTELTLPRIILGASYQKQFNKIGLLAEINADLTTDGERNVLLPADPISVDPVFGLELNYNRFIFLRGGVNTIQQETDLLGEQFWSVNPNLGVGIKIGGLNIDYAFSNVGEQSHNTYSHVISLMLDVNFDYLKRAMNQAK